MVLNASASLCNASVNTFTSAVLPFDKLIRRIKAWFGIRSIPRNPRVGSGTVLILRQGTPRLCKISRIASTVMVPFCTPDTWRAAFRHVCSRSVRLTLQTKVHGWHWVHLLHKIPFQKARDWYRGEGVGSTPSSQVSLKLQSLGLDGTHHVCQVQRKMCLRCVCARTSALHATHTHTHTHIARDAVKISTAKRCP